MFRNYFLITFRNLLKNKVFSTVNILGLAIGMATCFFIFLYVHFELGYDRFNKNAADLYRVNISYSGSFSNLPPMATNHPAVGPALKADFPEVVDFARVAPPAFMGTNTVSYTNAAGGVTTFNEDRICMVDPSFLTLFTFPFILGNPANALKDDNSVVISNGIAKKYFGKEDPMGKTVSINRGTLLKITGVFADVPENSHIKFDILSSLGPRGRDNWGWPEFYNYVLLAPGTNPKEVEAKFPAFVNKHLGPIMKQLSFGCAFHLERVTDIHLGQGYLKEPEVTGSKREIYFLSIIGALILIVAWINYINLSTAKSIERAKEVGLRKVAGASRWQLISQFIVESAVVNLLAILLATLIVIGCFPFFSAFAGKNISGDFLSAGLLQQPKFWLILIALFAMSAFLVGAYPAFVLSHYRPASVLKGKFLQSGKGIILRKLLVSLQFLLSILLIAGTIIVYKQLFYMRNHALGYNKDRIVVIKAPADTDSLFESRIAAFQSEMLRTPSVGSVTVTADVPGKAIVDHNSVRKAADDKSHNFITYILGVNEKFATTYQIDILAGRNLMANDSANFTLGLDNARVMVNEQVVRALGFKNNEQAIHQRIVFSYGNGETNAEIIGVVKDYHQQSLKEGYDPILYIYPSRTSAWSIWKYLSIRTNTDNASQTIASAAALYKRIFPGSPFEFFFLNEFFNNQYRGDERFGRVFSLFTGLAIFVACLGLLGLSSFVSRLRIKEIGIRKVLGASVSSILILFCKDFVKLLLIVSVVAIPVSWFVSEQWLRNYAFHTGLEWYVFILPPVVLLLISLTTIIIESLKTALRNPVTAIRSE